MLDFFRALSPRSAITYGLWRLSGRKRDVHVRTRLGPVIELRPTLFGDRRNNDFGVAYEIFVLDLYGDELGLDSAKVRRVVDLGANVGFSCLYWLARFPECKLDAYEPHPGHARQAARNIGLNGASHRVKLNQAGAGAKARNASLSDRGSGSTIGDGGDIDIAIVDVFPDLLNTPLDILKMDIEGGEYELMEDPRFAQINARAIFMEWHQCGAQGLVWCRDRLQALGYRVVTATDDGGHGMITAMR
ncbi:FkbM family methyltransferase [Falsiroseomonas sp.]|uniref:FkbM family methyltransferase n=1 Tax=Falsiroseomonas sp. TaxID=2870721 RepID=UPI002735A665|nr:FkbM family methyltransferase [Falsiroseomonas sp.]MDP3414443.1 FkbM family methyltransferase [Falsiroseomonas sp.]